MSTKVDNDKNIFEKLVILKSRHFLGSGTTIIIILLENKSNDHLLTTSKLFVVKLILWDLMN